MARELEEIRREKDPRGLRPQEKQAKTGVFRQLGAGAKSDPTLSFSTLYLPPLISSSSEAARIRFRFLVPGSS